MPKLTRREALIAGTAVAFLMGTGITYAADPIKIGYPANLTGSLASVDGPALNGAKLAAQEINAAGGVLGRQIELITYDTKSDATAVSTVASQLIDSDHVVAMVGFLDPDSVLAIAPQIEAAKIPFITPGATSPKLPAEAGTQVFMACFGDNVRIPLKPAIDSETKAATRSDFIPASVPI